MLLALLTPRYIPPSPPPPPPSSSVEIVGSHQGNDPEGRGLSSRRRGDGRLDYRLLVVFGRQLSARHSGIKTRHCLGLCSPPRPALPPAAILSFCSFISLPFTPGCQPRTPPSPPPRARLDLSQPRTAPPSPALPRVIMVFVPYSSCATFRRSTPYRQKTTRP